MYRYHLCRSVQQAASRTWDHSALSTSTLSTAVDEAAEFPKLSEAGLALLEEARYTRDIADVTSMAVVSDVATRSN